MTMLAAQCCAAKPVQFSIQKGATQLFWKDGEGSPFMTRLPADYHDANDVQFSIQEGQSY